ncbi:MAG: hypothetical protein ACYCT0_10525, partial [Sulfobacillus sp.]
HALDAGTVIRYQVRNPALVNSLLGTLHRGELEAIVAAQELMSRRRYCVKKPCLCGWHPH